MSEHSSNAVVPTTPTTRVTLVVGGVLTGVSSFLPWFHLSTSSPSDGPPEIDVNPWTVVHLDVGAPLLGLALALLLAALGILVSSILLAFSHSRRVKSALMSILLALAFLSLCSILLAQTSQRQVLRLRRITMRHRSMACCCSSLEI
jgi:hypothetical protein